ncbi:hypothetical protein AY599_25895 [Leptolyngbya valderiana BDU 20041]|nr:hypothetical protein AY599_25895 [Leptolyngbya valderiana BDU 20041]
MTAADPSPAAAELLDAAVVEAVTGVRSAYAELLSAVPREGPGAIGVERALGISKKLAWQVYRVATSDNPLGSGARVPGKAATRQVLLAASRAGVSASVTDRVREATERFHAVVSHHADDRSSFDLMVRSVSGDGIVGHDAELKRTAYRANRELVGRCCDVDLFTLLVRRSDTPGQMDMCSLRGLAGLRRLRPDVPLEISRHRFDQGEGNVRTREPVFGDASADGPEGLVEAFSSEPLPSISALVGKDGYTRFVAEVDRLGTTSAVSCYLCDMTRGLSIRSPDGTAAIGNIHEVATPAQVLYQDMLVDPSLLAEDAFGPAHPSLRVLARRPEATVWPGDDAGVVLPVAERLVRGGRGSGAVSAPELPAYPGMIRQIGERLGWNVEDMVLFRVRIEHPVLHSVVWMRLDLEGRLASD